MSELIDYAPYLLKGLLVTLMVFALGSVLAIVVAFAAGLGRLSIHRWVRWPSIVFIEVFRGTSLIVQLVWLFYTLPLFGIQLEPLTAAVLALGLNEGAYAAEIVRGAIASRGVGQNEACVALGMGRALRMRRVLIPQALPSMIPPFGNVLVDTLKNTTIVSLVTVSELALRAGDFRTNTGKTTEIYTVLLVVFFILSMMVAGLVKLAEKRFAIDRGTKAPMLRSLVLGRAEGGVQF